MARFRTRRILAGLAAGVVLAVGVRYYYWIAVEHRFVTITAGRIYQSARLPPNRLLQDIADHGIRTVIDLRDAPDETAAERLLLESRGVAYVNLPSKQVPAEPTVDAFLDVVGNPEALPALVHCQHGVNRSVLFAALYRIEFENWDNERARRATGFFRQRGNFAPDSPKGAYLRSYVPRRRAAPAGS